MQPMQTVLILGATGRFGRNAAEAFWNAGWRVRLFDRRTDNLLTASQGIDVIVNAWNPIYTDWEADLPKITQSVIAAAKHSGATVIIPGNVYVFGENAKSRFAADTSHSATNPLGRLRVQMEDSFRQSGVPTIVLRAGDFLDIEASGNWFDKVIAPSLAKGVLRYPGALDAPHAWTFLPDFARAAVALATIRHRLPQYIDVPYGGYTLTGAEMARYCADVLQSDVITKPMSWWPLRLAQPFWPMAKPLLEMRYLWNKSHWLDGSRFAELVPDFRATPPKDALRQAIDPVLREKSDPPKPNYVGQRPLLAEQRPQL